MATESLKVSQKINEQIRISPVRVIAEDGEQLGIMATDEAIKSARKVNLDLVLVAPTEKPPVCRIMDYGKFKYQQKKRQHKTPQPPNPHQGDPRAAQDGRPRHRGQGQPGP